MNRMSYNYEYHKAWKKNNPDKVKASQKAYRATHKEALTAAKILWAKNNPEKVIASRKRYNATHKEERTAYQKNNPAGYVTATQKYLHTHPEQYQALKDYNYLVVLVKKDGLWSNE